jgi:hypothetical protein
MEESLFLLGARSTDGPCLTCRLARRTPTVKDIRRCRRNET